MSLWYCECHGLHGPRASCPKAGRATAAPTPPQEAEPYTREELEALPSARLGTDEGGMTVVGLLVSYDRLRATALAGLEAQQDRERLDWLEATKRERGCGGWRIDPPSDGWPLQVFTRGPYHSIRAAIDAARTTGGEDE